MKKNEVTEKKRIVKEVFQLPRCEAVLNFALGKTGIITATNEFMGGDWFKNPEVSSDIKKYADFTIIEFKNGHRGNEKITGGISILTTKNQSYRDNVADFCQEANETLIRLSYLISGFQFAAEASIKEHCPDATNDQIKSDTKELAMKALRNDIFSFLSDDEFEKIYDNDWLSDNIALISVMHSDCSKKMNG